MTCYLVEGVAHVGVSVSVGGAVMEAKLLLGFSFSLPRVQLVETALLYNRTSDMVFSIISDLFRLSGLSVSPQQHLINTRDEDKLRLSFFFIQLDLFL